MMKSARSETLAARAAQHLAGGVSASWNYLSGGTKYFSRAAGMRLWDVDQIEYIDFMAGHSSLMLGHNPPVVADAIFEALKRGFGCQCETEQHVELAELICELIPCAELIRLANSGLEATMYALRLARAYTGRSIIIKVEGHFHGLHNSVLFSTDMSPRLGARNEDGTIEPVPGSAGIPDSVAPSTITIPFNDLEALHQVMAKYGPQIAAIIVEPVAFNLGFVPATPAFIQSLRELTDKYESVLIFDEVLTGFRIALGGAQEVYKVVPDLACYGKAFGCGAPIAALVGRRHIMQKLSPIGDVEMSGTNTGRWLTVLITLATLREYVKPGFYERLSNSTTHMIHGLRQAFNQHGLPAFVDGLGGCVGVYFGLEEQPNDLPAIKQRWNYKYTAAFFEQMLNVEHVYGFMPPAPHHPERFTITFAHTEQDLDETLDHVEAALSAVPYFES